MTKEISLSDYRLDYKQQLRKLFSDLSCMEDTLKDHASLLALNGKWRSWADEQPVGARIYVTREMLVNADDSTITALVKLIDEIVDLRDQLIS